MELRVESWSAVRGADALPGLDDRLPRRHSLRRASDESKAAVVAAVEALGDRRGGTAAYVGLQRGSLDYTTQFIDATYRDGPRLASPLLFSESVANNAATHLSLTLGLTGTVATFIGSRAAGIQAVSAARDDLDAGVADRALVVVQSFPTPLTFDAYHAVTRPFARRSTPPPPPSEPGSAALVLGPGPGRPLLYAGARCLGRSPDAQVAALKGLWGEFRRIHGGPVRTLASTSVFAPPGEILRRAMGPDAPEPEEVPERFALDPVLRLLEAGAAAAVACLSEEGTAGVLALGAG